MASLSMSTMVLMTFVLVVGFVVGWQLVEDWILEGSHPSPVVHIFRGTLAGTLAAALVAMLARVKEQRQRRIMAQLRRSEENLRAAYRELEATQAELVGREKWATLGTFAATLSHEMKNPLSGLLGHLQLIERKAGRQETLRTEDLADSLARIRREAVRLDGLVNQFTDMARSGELRRERCELRPLLARTITLVEETARRRDIAIGVAEGSDVLANADEARVARALYNLLVFAIETSPSGAAIAVSVVEDATSARFLIPVSPEARRLATNGGAPAESMSTLGLTLAQEIARLHGGSVGFEGKGKGEVLAFSLPTLAS